MPLVSGKPIVVGRRKADEHAVPDHLKGRLFDSTCSGCGAAVLFTLTSFHQIHAGVWQPSCTSCAARHDARQRGTVPVPVSSASV